jgi:hypothetical protein
MSQLRHRTSVDTGPPTVTLASKSNGRCASAISAAMRPKEIDYLVPLNLG